jgi:alkylhydroperoxidase family enzyme
LREALAWTEGITEVNGDQVRTECTALAREYFEDGKLADLTMAVIAINSWNRLPTSFRAVAGTYEPAKEHAAG